MNPASPRRVRRPGTNLLVRAPATASLRAATAAAMSTDPVAQLARLAELCERGWLSRQELALHKAEVLAAYRED